LKVALNTIKQTKQNKIFLASFMSRLKKNYKFLGQEFNLFKNKLLHPYCLKVYFQFLSNILQIKNKIYYAYMIYVAECILLQTPFFYCWKWR
jgi:hypothetical protein